MSDLGEPKSPKKASTKKSESNFELEFSTTIKRKTEELLLAWKTPNSTFSHASYVGWNRITMLLGLLIIPPKGFELIHLGGNNLS
jgi:hypothetical protein